MEYLNGVLISTNTTSQTITRTSLDGQSASILENLFDPVGASVTSGGQLIFIEHSNGGVFRTNLDGAEPSLLAQFDEFGPQDTAIGERSIVYASDAKANAIWRIDGAGETTLFASGFTGKVSPPVIGPTGLATDSQGNMFVADGPYVWRINPIDTDGDGLFDVDEVEVHGTDPNKSDSDDDGVLDPIEIREGTSPVDSASLNSYSADLLALYGMEGNARDLTGNGNDGLILGEPEPAVGIDGREGSAIRFDGSDDMINLGAIPLTGGSFTVSFWWRQWDDQRVQYVFSQGSRTAGQGLNLRYDITHLRFSFWFDDADTPGPIDPEEWRMISCVFDSAASAQRIYVDGELSVSRASGSFAGQSDFAIGTEIWRNDVSPSLTGILDEFRIYRRALTAGEIEALYKTELPVNDADNDGLSDSYEPTVGLDPSNPDTDGDGILDGQEDEDEDGLTVAEEAAFGTSPSSPDTDSDGLTDSEEVNTHGTNPLSGDSDDDLLGDAQEVNLTRTNPLLADTDGNGTPDADEDLDKDSFTNLQEVDLLLTDPLDGTSRFRAELIHSGDAHSLSFKTLAGRRYRVERSVDLTADGWMEVITFVGSGSSVTMPLGAPFSQRWFYRVVVSFD